MLEKLLEELEEEFKNNEWELFNDEGEDCNRGMDTQDALACVKRILKNYKVYKL